MSRDAPPGLVEIADHDWPQGGEEGAVAWVHVASMSSISLLDPEEGCTLGLHSVHDQIKDQQFIEVHD